MFNRCEDLHDDFHAIPKEMDHSMSKALVNESVFACLFVCLFSFLM